MAQSELACGKEGSARAAEFLSEFDDISGPPRAWRMAPAGSMAGSSKASWIGGVATVHRIGKTCQSKISALICVTNSRAKGGDHRTRPSSRCALCCVISA